MSAERKTHGRGCLRTFVPSYSAMPESAHLASASGYERMTVGWSYATEHADPGEFSRLPVARVQSLGQHRARHAVRPPE